MVVKISRVFYAIIFFIGVVLITGCTQKIINNNQVDNQNKINSNVENRTGVEKDELYVCQSGQDCIIVNKETMFSCCWAGACDEIDWSLDKYIGINKARWGMEKNNRCYNGLDENSAEGKQLLYDKCGPAPKCPIFLKNANFEAKCITGMCTKVPK